MEGRPRVTCSSRSHGSWSSSRWPRRSRSGATAGPCSGRASPVPELKGLGALQQENDRACRRGRAVLDPARDREEITRVHLDRRKALELDPEFTLPAQEQLVLIVVVPRKFALDGGDAHHRVVRHNEVPRLERPLDVGSRVRDRDGAVHDAMLGEPNPRWSRVEVPPSVGPPPAILSRWACTGSRSPWTTSSPPPSSRRSTGGSTPRAHRPRRPCWSVATARPSPPSTPTPCTTIARVGPSSTCSTGSSPSWCGPTSR